MWTWDKNKKEFTQIYKNYDDGLRIFTPAQLLQELEDVSKSQPLAVRHTFHTLQCM